MKVGVLGGGAWGQAIARLVIAAGHEPLIGYRDERPPAFLPSTPRPTEVSASCELLFVATSASLVRDAIRLADPTSDNVVIVAGRGLDPVSGDWLTDAVQQECDATRVGALAGPAPVAEILNGGLCAGVVASREAAVRDLAVEALHSHRYRAYGSSDLMGVQLCGAMVPVMACLLGLMGSLPGGGSGLQGMLLARGLADTARLGLALGCDALTFSGLAGVGDLVAVQARPGHPNYDAGVAMGRGALDQGPVRIATAVLPMARLVGVELPLTSALVAMSQGLPPVDAVSLLMSRGATREGG